MAVLAVVPQNVSGLVKVDSLPNEDLNLAGLAKVYYPDLHD